MKRIKEILGVLFYPILLLVVEFGLIFVFTLIFNITNDYEIGSLEYTENLSVFFNNNRIWIVLLSFILLLPLFKKKCNINKFSFNLKNIILLILLGVGFGLTYNLVLLNLNKLFPFTTIFEGNNSTILITLITSGLIGPIMEELVFRNIVYERLKKIVKPFVAIILTGLLFGLLHGNLIQFIYAFLFNFVLIFVYEKHKSIYAPIIVHVSANSGLQLYLSLINYNNIYISIVSLVMSLIIVLISYKLMNKEQNNG